jgi:dolichyl-phosphate beta-glucosyltransferase
VKPKLTIIIPAYNEEKRLPQTLENLRKLTLSADFPWDLRHVIVVNDGSIDHTDQVVEEFKPRFPGLEMLMFRGNLGKGAAVFAGLLETETYYHGANDVVLVADADEATPWKELVALHAAYVRAPDCFLIFGSRRHPESAILTRQVWWRERMGRIFNQLLRFVTGVPYKDTQCGFKLFKSGQDLRDILQRWTVARFAWDAEVVLNAIALRLPIVEHPIEWRHIEESRVHPLRDGLQMAFEILKIRMKQSISWNEGPRLHNQHFDRTPMTDRVKTQIISNKIAISENDRSEQKR